MVKKPWICMIAAVILAAGGCAAQDAPASVMPALSPTPALSASSAPTPTLQPVSTPVATLEAEAGLDVVMLTACEAGEYAGEAILEDEADMQTVSDAIMEAMISSYAWPAADMGEVLDYVLIHAEYTDGQVAEYYAFEADGSFYLQGSDGETCAPIRKETFDALRALAAG